ncbi:MAG: SDR family oxidoreductase [Pseudomonadota bacterium]
MHDFKGKTAIVTGSSAGLGRSMAIKLAEAGANIIVNYASSRDAAEEVSEICRGHGVETLCVQADMNSDEGCQTLADAAKAWGHLDILINNAGTTKRVPNHADLKGLSREDFLSLTSINVAAPFLMVQACEDLLRASFEKNGQAAAVLNTSSIAGVTGIGSSVAYAATKGALNTLTLSLARALAPAIRVNAVCPGYIDTRWFSDHLPEEKYLALRASVEERTPLKAASGPDDIADAALFLVSDASRHVTGETLLVDAGTHLGFASLSMR